MKIIVLDQLGCYAAVAAASYLAGNIGKNPSTLEISRLAGFAAHTDLRPGTLSYKGRVKNGVEIYTLGAGTEGKLVRVSAYDLYKIMNIRERVVILDVAAFNPSFFIVLYIMNLFKPLRKIVAFCAAHFIKRKMPALLSFVEKELDLGKVFV